MDLELEVTPTPIFVDVVVVGAGLSGLRAAMELQEAGCSFVVLEERPRVGGKTLSVEMEAGHGLKDVQGLDKIDLGASWINSTTQSEMYDLTQRFGLELVEQHVADSHLYQRRNGTVDSFSTAFGHDIQSPAARLLYPRLDGYAASWLGPDDAPTFDQCDVQSLGRVNYPEDIQAADDAAQFLTEAFLGIDSTSVSCLYMINLIRSCGGLETMSSSAPTGAQHLRIRQGAQSLSHAMAASLPPSTLHLATKVSTITQRPGCGLLVTTTAPHTVFHCHRLILALPTTASSTILFTPPLPPPKQTLIARTVTGFLAKCVLVFSSPWWRATGLSGAMDSLSPLGPVLFTRDTSDAEGRFHSLTCFLAGDRARAWVALDAKARRAAVLDHLTEVFGSQPGVWSVPEPVGVYEAAWAEGTVPVVAPDLLWAVSPVGVDTVMAGGEGLFGEDQAGVLAMPFELVHFAGAETADVWRGHMEGAVRSGVRAAREVVVALKERDGVGGMKPSL